MKTLKRGDATIWLDGADEDRLAESLRRDGYTDVTDRVMLARLYLTKARFSWIDIIAMSILYAVSRGIIEALT